MSAALGARYRPYTCKANRLLACTKLHPLLQSRVLASPINRIYVRTIVGSKRPSVPGSSSSCKQFRCQFKCKNGYQTDAYGCPLCLCKDACYDVVCGNFEICKNGKCGKNLLRKTHL